MMHPVVVSALLASLLIAQSTCSPVVGGKEFLSVRQWREDIVARCLALHDKVVQRINSHSGENTDEIRTYVAGLEMMLMVLQDKDNWAPVPEAKARKTMVAAENELAKAADFGIRMASGGCKYRQNIFRCYQAA